MFANDANTKLGVKTEGHRALSADQKQHCCRVLSLHTNQSTTASFYGRVEAHVHLLLGLGLLLYHYETEDELTLSSYPDEVSDYFLYLYNPNSQRLLLL